MSVLVLVDVVTAIISHQAESPPFRKRIPQVDDIVDRVLAGHIAIGIEETKRYPIDQ